MAFSVRRPLPIAVEQILYEYVERLAVGDAVVKTEGKDPFVRAGSDQEELAQGLRAEIRLAEKHLPQMPANLSYIGAGKLHSFEDNGALPVDISRDATIGFADEAGEHKVVQAARLF